ncbi:unnamed protein product [Penicillium salamii]|uniref:Chromatin assembly factor 1 subunit A n=1 Tax=Penicillium salamii TaxID=1612424 RepID=A0A9W4NU96_9EURO|nr:unnamed protein product [Penicillium salamii]
MESHTRLSPMPPVPSFQTSPSGARKRSIHEVDGDSGPSPNFKSPVTENTGENQENRDPSLPPPVDHAVSTSHSSKPTMTPRQSVEVVVRSSSRQRENAKCRDLELTSPSNKASNPEPDTPASKKRKVASASKDAKQQEKEAKERQRAEEKIKKEEEKAKREEEKLKREEEKAKREEEKRLKAEEKAEEKRKRETEREEEKRKREAQRDEKKKAKEDEKAAKDEEKRKKDEEKEKKIRSQPKLNSFFVKPSLPSASAAQATHVPSSPRKSSTAEDPKTSPRGLKSDYEREFPPFFLKSHTIVAPPHRFERDAQALRHVRQTVDSSMSKDPADEVLPFRPSELFQFIPFHRSQGDSTHAVKDLVAQLQKSADSVQPDEHPRTNPSSRPQELLRKVKMKSLKFGEDIRPSYQGTFTRPVSASSARKLSRNPYHRGLPETNYDYDSEAEWEEPEEGEELDSEEEDEASDDGEDDLEGFLDDEDDALAGGKRRPIVGDLEPVTTGIQWAADGVTPETKIYQIQTISDAVQFPIDPFSTAYWDKPKPVDQSAKARGVSGLAFATPALPGMTVTAGLLPPSKAKRPFPPDQLSEFKEAVEGSDLSKIGLVEILKKRFPKVSKDTLKATLDQVAIRAGQKEVDKKWVCR